MKVTLLSCIVLFLALTVRAELLLNDSFDYPDGPLVTVSGGVWSHHSGGTTGEVSVVSGRVILNETNSEDVNALLSGQPYDPTGSTNIFYTSFMVRLTALPSTAGTYFAHFKSSSATTFSDRIWAFTRGAASGKFRLGLSAGSSLSATNATDLDLNTDYLVVTRFKSSDSSAKLWINPVAETDPSVSTSEPATPFTVVACAFRESGGEGEMSIDDLRVGTSFVDAVTNAPDLSAPSIVSAPANQSVTEGDMGTFSVTANGTPPLNYQWQFNGTNLPGATGSNLFLAHASFTQSGFYIVVVSNAIDSTASQPVTLNVFSKAPPAFSILTYNTHGNGVENWSTNTLHVRAIGNQARYLQPDLITFQEIPVTNNGTALMSDFVSLYLPGYQMITNSATDGYIRSVIISRFPIIASNSWLHYSDLTPFGYSGSGFTRDLFEAVVSVPGFSQPLHVFTVHLKSGQDTDSASKRAAEAGAVSNFFVTTFLPAHPFEPYLLTGDMNEDIMRQPASNPQSIETLVSPPVGLKLTTPFNPLSAGELTFSIQSSGGLTRRYDYILPSGLLFSNAVSSQVFRTDLLSPLPAGLYSNDDMVASDHLPVLLTFGNPYDQPFRVTSLIANNQSLSLTWESVPGQSYELESSSNLTSWVTIATGLFATNNLFEFKTNLPTSMQFLRVKRVD